MNFSFFFSNLMVTERYSVFTNQNSTLSNFSVIVSVVMRGHNRIIYVKNKFDWLKLLPFIQFIYFVGCDKYWDHFVCSFFIAINFQIK